MRFASPLLRRLPTRPPRTPLLHAGTQRTFTSTTRRLQPTAYTKYTNSKDYTRWRRWGLGATTLAVTAVPVIIADAKAEEESSSEDGGSEPEPEEHIEAEKTVEEQMLEASQKEKKEAADIPQDAPLHTRMLKGAKLVFVYYVYEPMATGIRFIKLATIFLPVLLSVPAIWIGARQPDRSDERSGTLWWYGFLVWGLETAGPTFIKLGQWAASRTDIFPTELCELMSRLHSNAKQHSMHATRRIVSAAFGGRPFDEIFEDFDEQPLGVGAIAQVYKARIRHDLVPPLEEDTNKPLRRVFREKVDDLVKSAPSLGAPSSYVAIKVIHPNVDKLVNRDLKIIRFFAVLLNAIPTLEWLSFPDEVDTFADMMRLQLDLRIEAENLAKFRQNFKDRTTVTFPYPYREYTTRDVLIEEFAHGIPLAAFLESGGGTYQQEVANMGLDAFLHMLVMDNFIHSDLHPGNIMVRFLKPHPSPLFSHLPLFGAPVTPTTDTADATAEVRARLTPHRKNRQAWTAELNALDAEGYRPQLVFLDTGLVTELNALNRRNFLALFRAIAEFDGYRAGRLMIERSRSPGTVLDGEGFAVKMGRLVTTVKSRTLALGNISFGDILSEVLAMVRTHHVRMEGDFVNVVLSMLLLEGIGRSLDPEMDLLASSLPMLRAVGAAGAAAGGVSGMAGMARGGGGGDDEGTTWSLLKVWIALEARQFVNTTVHDVERCVKYDLLSPNI